MKGLLFLRHILTKISQVGRKALCAASDDFCWILQVDEMKKLKAERVSCFQYGQ